MKKLSRSDLARRDGYIESLRDLAGKIEDEIRELQENALTKLNTLVDEYNETLAEAGGFVEDLSSQMEDYYADRSEKWQEGDAGSAYSEWKDAFGQFDADAIEPFTFDLSDEGFDHADKLEEMQAEPEGE